MVPDSVRARHMLIKVVNNDTAKARAKADSLKNMVKQGMPFEVLAMTNSEDPGSAAKGGDLGWFTLDRMVKPFSDAVATLEKGQVTAQPVQSEFGWHVIRLDDVREAQLPPFEQVKPQVQQELERRRVQELQKELRAKAKIQ